MKELAYNAKMLNLTHFYTHTVEIMRVFNPIVL
jgi:hypothetical protein